MAYESWRRGRKRDQFLLIAVDWACNQSVVTPQKLDQLMSNGVLDFIIFRLLLQTKTYCLFSKDAASLRVKQANNVTKREEKSMLMNAQLLSYSNYISLCYPLCVFVMVSRASMLFVGIHPCSSVFKSHILTRSGRTSCRKCLQRLL